MNFDFNPKFIIGALIIALLIVPISFNFLFMWESGLSRGGSSDWFTLYGNIFGGLTGGFFTYLAVLLTLNHNQKTREKETAPQLDILHKNVEFRENEIGNEPNKIGVEITNIGGSIAKNIECTLSIPNIESVINFMQDSDEKYKSQILEVHKDVYKRKLWTIEERDENKNILIDYKYLLPNYSPKFIGHCIPNKLDTTAKVEYFMNSSITFWIQSILSSIEKAQMYETNELLKFHLTIKYGTAESKEMVSTFELYWEFITIDYEVDTNSAIFKYILRSKLIKQVKENKQV